MITVDTTVKEIKNDRVLKKIAHYLIYNTAEDGTEHLSDESRTLRDIQDKTPTWSAKDMAYGLNCIIENGGDGKELLRWLWSCVFPGGSLSGGSKIK